MFKNALILAFVCCFAPVLTAQSAKNPTAMTALRKMVSTTGWARPSLPRDAILSANIESYAEDGSPVSSGTLSVRSLGARKFISETTIAGQKIKTIALNGRYVIDGPEGRSFFPMREGTNLGIPFFAECWDFENEDWMVRYLGSETISGQNTAKIKLWREPSSESLRNREILRGSEAIIWISTASSVPVQVQYKRGAASNALAFSEHTRRFSEFKAIRGRLVPFRIEEYVFDKLVYSLNVTGFDLDAGVSEQEFDEAEVAK